MDDNHSGRDADLQIKEEKVGPYRILQLKGEVDVYTAPKLREAIIMQVEEGERDIVVDLEDVDFLDSTGLGVLVGGLKRVKPFSGSLGLICTQEKILRIFRITGLTKVFPIFSSKDQLPQDLGR
ncbi:MAG: STAS domain-containing protein [Candidatus Geothermincolia bacterium]